jgi:hypothetical protein
MGDCPRNKGRITKLEKYIRGNNDEMIRLYVVNPVTYHSNL